MFYSASGLIAVARHSQGISPKHCTSPAQSGRGAIGGMSGYHKPVPGGGIGVSNVQHTVFEFPRSTFVKVTRLFVAGKGVNYSSLLTGGTT
jgi:hypothetical protein